ncbi:MAG: heparinase II/III-family protein, partial [Bacteroidales bacterium]|nr:heparinase II/III-family protein [Bacteroidales bacterium]
LYVGRGPTPVTLIHTTWTMDENDTFLGVLGGSAGTPHAHEDAGSFVFDAEGVRWAADLGWQTYRIAEEHLKEFWSNRNGSDRWSVFRFKNQNHNTLTINDAEHVTKAFAPITDSFYEDGRGGATVDLSETLGDQLVSAVRTFRIEGDDLFVTDSLTALANKDACVRWTLVSRGEPTLEGGGVTLRAGDRTRYLSSESAVDWTIWSTKAPNDWEEDNSDFHMCGYTTTLKAGQCATITVRLSKNLPE